MVNEWTRKDVPGAVQVLASWDTAPGDGYPLLASHTLDAVVEHLNAHHPKPAREVDRHDLPDFGAMGSVMARWKVSYGAVSDVLDAVVAHLNANGGLPADDRWRRAHSIVEQERDQARAERDEANRNRDEAASRLAGVRDAHQRSADAHMKWKARAEAAERERDEAKQAYCDLYDGDVVKVAEWKARAEAAEARTAPADPVVLVIGESDVEACQVRRRPPSSLTSEGDWEAADQTWLYSKGVTVEALDEEIDVNIRGVIEALAVRRAIEAEQAVDPAEQKARELYEAGHPVGIEDVAHWDNLAPGGKDMYRRIAAHVLGQEDRHVDR